MYSRIAFSWYTSSSSTYESKRSSRLAARTRLSTEWSSQQCAEEPDKQLPLVNCERFRCQADESNAYAASQNQKSGMLLGFLHGGYVSDVTDLADSQGLGALLSPLVATTVLAKGWIWYRFYVGFTEAQAYLSTSPSATPCLTFSLWLSPFGQTLLSARLTLLLLATVRRWRCE